MTSWKVAESRIGVWYGAKGIKKSGRQPLSGGNSGQTRGDSPHPTIFIESKRDTKYHSAIKLWRKYKKEYKKKLFVLALPIVDDNKVVSKTSKIWCIHNKQFEDVVNALRNEQRPEVAEWAGVYPSALTLYEEAVSICSSSIMDRRREIVTCNLVYHGHPGFWIIINSEDILRCWDLILEARIIREKLIQEEGL